LIQKIVIIFVAEETFWDGKITKNDRQRADGLKEKLFEFSTREKVNYEKQI